MNTHLLETRPSPDHPIPRAVAAHPLSVRPSAARVGAADRLALRLGMALVIWGRRNVDRAARDRVAARDRAVARAGQELGRIGRERAAGRELLLSVPRR